MYIRVCLVFSSDIYRAPSNMYNLPAALPIRVSLSLFLAHTFPKRKINKYEFESAMA